VVVRWQIYDPDTDDTWVFPMNPREGAVPTREKNIAQQAVAASDSSNVLLFEGADSPSRINWDGTILTEDFYVAMEEWFDKRRQVRLTDDLGQTWWVYLIRFTPRRINRHSHPWAMTYEAEVLIVNWPNP
jgi:hypothetical protein